MRLFDLDLTSDRHEGFGLGDTGRTIKERESLENFQKAEAQKAQARGTCPPVVR